jgi:hypothetical protein
MPKALIPRYFLLAAVWFDSARRMRIGTKPLSEDSLPGIVGRTSAWTTSLSPESVTRKKLRGVSLSRE